jgi:hypothetical protein
MAPRKRSFRPSPAWRRRRCSASGQTNDRAGSRPRAEPDRDLERPLYLPGRQIDRVRGDAKIVRRLSLSEAIVKRTLWLALSAILWTSAASADNPILSPYQQTATSDCPSGADVCSLSFPAVTAETLISHVSCILDLKSTTSSLIYVSLANGSYEDYLPTFSDGTFQNSPYYTISAQTYLFFSPTQTPTISMYGYPAVPGYISCIVSGYTRPSGPLPPSEGTPPPSSGPIPPSALQLPPFAHPVPAQ